MREKALGLLGLARRAGVLEIGFDAACSALKSGKAALAVTASDISPKTAKECRFAAGDAGRIQPLPFDKSALAAAIGAHRPVGVAAVCDKGFAKALAASLADK